MSKFFKPKSILILFLVALTAVGCSSDDNTSIEIPDNDDDTDNPVDPPTFDADLYVDEAGADMRDVTVKVEANDSGLETIKAKIRFATTSETMRRLYVTENINDAGIEAEEAFVFIEDGLNTKKDGSLDLPANKGNGFEYQILLPAPTAEEGNIVYKFWTTTGRGDFRDPEKRAAIVDGVGTITVNVGNGTGTDTSSGIREYPEIILRAPLNDESSETFMSLFNGELYAINEQETAALWDMGYYYLPSMGVGASLASPSMYRDDIVDVPATSELPLSELNNTFFALSSATVADFNAVIINSDIDAIVTSTPTSELVNDLQVGNVVAVVDQYGKKGLIRIDKIEPGFGAGGNITIAIKMQS